MKSCTRRRLMNGIPTFEEIAYKRLMDGPELVQKSVYRLGKSFFYIFFVSRLLSRLLFWAKISTIHASLTMYVFTHVFLALIIHYQKEQMLLSSLLFCIKIYVVEALEFHWICTIPLQTYLSATFCRLYFDHYSISWQWHLWLYELYLVNPLFIQVQLATLAKISCIEAWF